MQLHSRAGIKSARAPTYVGPKGAAEASPVSKRVPRAFETRNVFVAGKTERTAMGMQGKPPVTRAHKAFRDESSRNWVQVAGGRAATPKPPTPKPPISTQTSKTPSVSGRLPLGTNAKFSTGVKSPQPPSALPEKVRVAVRVRPLNQVEKYDNGQHCIHIHEHHTDGISVRIDKDTTRHKGCAEEVAFGIDFGFPSEVSQEEVYRKIGAPLLSNALEGYNSTLLAYGQTSSGKTHTMMGDIDEDGAVAVGTEGIVPRMCEDVFERIRTLNDAGGDSWAVKVVYVEIYQEKVTDLLSKNRYEVSTTSAENNTTFVLVGAHRIDVASTQDVLEALQRGNKHRRTAATKMNDRSSRSHAIFTLELYKKLSVSLPGGGDGRVGSTNTTSITPVSIRLVDLAGSERMKDSGSTQGSALAEAITINQSLFELRQVIEAVAERQKPSFRNSVLTMLLKDSFGGNSKTTMIATVAPTVAYMGQTALTIQFACRARTITNKPAFREESHIRDIRLLKGTISELMLQLGNMGEKKEGDTLSCPEKEKLKLQLSNAVQLIEQLQSEAQKSEIERNKVDAALISTLEAQAPALQTREQELSEKQAAIEADAEKREQELNDKEASLERRDQQLSINEAAFEVEKNTFHRFVENVSLKHNDCDVLIEQRLKTANSDIAARWVAFYREMADKVAASEAQMTATLLFEHTQESSAAETESEDDVHTNHVTLFAAAMHTAECTSEDDSFSDGITTPPTTPYYDEETLINMVAHTAPASSSSSFAESIPSDPNDPDDEGLIGDSDEDDDPTPFDTTDSDDWDDEDKSDGKNPIASMGSCTCTNFDTCTEIEGLVTRCVAAVEGLDYASKSTLVIVRAAMNIFVPRHRYLARSCTVGKFVTLFTLASWIVYPKHRVQSELGAYRSACSLPRHLNSLVQKAARIPDTDVSALVDQNTVIDFCIYLWGKPGRGKTYSESELSTRGGAPTPHELRRTFVTKLFAVSGGGVAAVFRLLLSIDRHLCILKSERQRLGRVSPLDQSRSLHDIDCSFECIDSWEQDFTSLPPVFLQQHWHLIPASKRTQGVIHSDITGLLVLANALNLLFEEEDVLDVRISAFPDFNRVMTLLNKGVQWRLSVLHFDELQKKISALKDDNCDDAIITRRVESLRSALWGKRLCSDSNATLTEEDAATTLQAQMLFAADIVASPDRRSIFKLLLNMYRFSSYISVSQVGSCTCTSFDTCTEIEGLVTRCVAAVDTEGLDYTSKIGLVRDEMDIFVPRHLHLAHRGCTGKFVTLFKLASWIVYPKHRVQSELGVYRIMAYSVRSLISQLNSLVQKAARIPDTDASALVDQNTVVDFCIYLWGTPARGKTYSESELSTRGGAPTPHELRRTFATKLFAVSGGGVAAVFRLLLDINRRNEG